MQMSVSVLFIIIKRGEDNSTGNMVVYLNNGLLLWKKKKEIELLTHATAWINLKSIIMDERSQTQKAVLCDCLKMDGLKGCTGTRRNFPGAMRG